MKKSTIRYLLFLLFAIGFIVGGYLQANAQTVNPNVPARVDWEAYAPNPADKTFPLLPSDIGKTITVEARTAALPGARLLSPQPVIVSRNDTLLSLRYPPTNAIINGWIEVKIDGIVRFAGSLSIHKNPRPAKGTTQLSYVVINGKDADTTAINQLSAQVASDTAFFNAQQNIFQSATSGAYDVAVSANAKATSASAVASTALFTASGAATAANQALTGVSSVSASVASTSAVAASALSTAQSATASAASALTGVAANSAAIIARVVHVADIASLTLTSGSSINSVVVRDKDRGGTFLYAPTSYTADDGVVFPANGGGFWVRQYNSFPNLKWWGAKGDGVNDDIIPVNKAIQYVVKSAYVAGIGQLSGTLFAPRGTYNLSDVLIVPNKVRILGEGARITSFRPHGTTFPSTHFCELTNKNEITGRENTFTNCLEHLSIDLKKIVGLVGVYSDEINEQSGLMNFGIFNIQYKGIEIKANLEKAGVGPQNFYLEKGEVILADNNDANSIGIDIDINGGTFQSLRQITIFGRPNAVSGLQQATGISISNASGWNSQNCHFEGLDVGYRLSKNGQVFAFSIINANSQNGVNATIYIHGVNDTYGGFMSAIRSSASKFAIQDFKNQATGFTNIPGPLGFYSIGSETTGVRTIRSTYLSVEKEQLLTLATAPTTSTLPSGSKPRLIKVTADNTVKWYINDGGTIKASPAFN